MRNGTDIGTSGWANEGILQRPESKWPEGRCLRRPGTIQCRSRNRAQQTIGVATSSTIRGRRKHLPSELWALHRE
jgi:hypothetical protein